MSALFNCEGQLMLIYCTLQRRRLKIGAAALAAILFSSVGALELREATASDGQATLVQARPAASTEKRLKTLETKTDYFKKKNMKIKKTYKIKKTNSPLAGQTCNGSDLILSINPNINFGGTSYAWLTTKINYQFQANLKRFEIFFGQDREGGAVCGKYAPANSSGTVTTKRFCSFDVESGDTYRVSISVIVGDQYGNACDYISEINVELKSTNIEVIEPQ